MNDEYLRSQRQMSNNPNIEGEHQSPRSNRSATPPFNNQMKQSPTVKTERPFTPVSANQNMPSPMAPSSTTQQQASPSVTTAPPPPPPTSHTTTGATTGEKRKNTSPSSGSSKKRLLSGVTLHDASKYANARDLEFFEKVKRMFKSETVYQNFLKCISIYNQEIINRKECSSKHSEIDLSQVT